MQPYLRINEMMWVPHKDVEAARRHDAWGPFHKACGRENLFFDLPSTVGRSGFHIVAFRTHSHRAGGVWTEKLADGRGKTVFAALEAAFRATGIPVPAAEPLLDRMLGRDTDDFDTLLEDDFEDIL